MNKNKKISNKIKKLMKEGKEHKQAIAISINMNKPKKRKK